MMQTPTKPGRPTSPLTSHQFALTTVADPATVWTALTDGDLTRRYLNGLAAHSAWTPGAPLTFRSGGEPAGPLTAGQLTGQVLRAEPPRQLSYLLQSGPCTPCSTRSVPDQASQQRASRTSKSSPSGPSGRGDHDPGVFRAPLDVNTPGS
jgi:hypothetical protein